MKVIKSDFVHSISTLPFYELKISTKEHRQLFPKVKKTIFFKHKYYINKSVVVINSNPNTLAKVASLFLFPVAVLMVGAPEAASDMKDLWSNKVSYTDYAWAGCDIHNKLIEQIEEEVNK